LGCVVLFTLKTLLRLCDDAIQKDQNVEQYEQLLRRFNQ